MDLQVKLKDHSMDQLKELQGYVIEQRIHNYIQEKVRYVRIIMRFIHQLANAHVYLYIVLFNLALDQMDVVSVFLYGTLNEMIFMTQSVGFAKRGESRDVGLQVTQILLLIDGVSRTIKHLYACRDACKRIY